MAVAADAFSSERLVLDRYRPLRPLGTGGSGSVWLARDERTGVDVALKVVPRDGKAGPRAEREAVAATRLRHERCQRPHDFASDAEHVYIAYEYVPGRTLRDALRAGELRERGIVEAAAQVLDGLAHAHARGIVHRDVKPANVLLADGPAVSVRLLDFGLAQIEDAEALTAPGDVPGTLAYIAPERLRGDPGTTASDVWSVAVMLWEALAGRHPFAAGSLVETARRIEQGAPSLSSARPDLPASLTRAVDRALATAPAARPSADELARRLRAAARPQAATPPRMARLPKLPHLPTLPQLPEVDVARLAGAARSARPLKTLVPPVLAALLAGWGAAVLPFYPSGWALALALLAGLTMLAAPRTALALALLAPVLPLGNVSAGLAILYALGALAWLVLFFPCPRAGPGYAAGPLLAFVGALGFVPLALLGVRSALRRFALGAACVVTAGIAAGLHHDSVPLAGGRFPRALQLDATASPVTAARIVWAAVAPHPEFLFRAAAIGALAAALPALRARGTVGAVAGGVWLLLAALFPAPSTASLPLVFAALVTPAVLILADGSPRPSKALSKRFRARRP